MREINQIIIHCSYTPADMDIGANEIRVWHVNDRGWRDIGYHWVIRRDGTREMGRPETAVGAHAHGNNKASIGICMVGGKSDTNRAECNFTRAQWRELDLLVTQKQMEYPDAKVIGHNEVSSKTCPTFDVQKWNG